RTLSNAIAEGRIAQAFILTGVRGVGKTTTARIIARALNCIGIDGTGGPTISPCGECVHCRSIAEDRHVDVIEMDAASRTGIADRGLVFDLFETVLKGDAKSALQQVESLYQGGADPLMIMQDLLDLTHFVTRLKLAPEAGSGDPLEEGDRERAQPLAAALSM